MNFRQLTLILLSFIFSFTINGATSEAQLSGFKKNKNSFLSTQVNYRICLNRLSVKNPGPNKLWDQAVKNTVTVVKAGLAVGATMVAPGSVQAAKVALASKVLSDLQPIESLVEDTIDAPDLYVEVSLGNTTYLRSYLVKNSYDTIFKDTCVLVKKVNLVGRPIKINVFDLDVQGKDIVGSYTYRALKNSDLRRGVNTDLRFENVTSLGLVIVKDR